MDKYDDVGQDLSALLLPIDDPHLSLLGRLTEALAQNKKKDLQEVFAAIIQQSASRMLHIALRFENNRQDAEDLVGNTLCKIWDLLCRQPLRENGKARFVKWADWECFYVRTMKNIRISAHRKRKIDECPLIGGDPAYQETGFTDVENRMDSSVAFENFLKTLTPQELNVVEATLESTSQEEVARVLEVKLNKKVELNTIYVTLNHVRAKVKSACLYELGLPEALDSGQMLRMIAAEKCRRSDTPQGRRRRPPKKKDPP